MGKCFLFIIYFIETFYKYFHIFFSVNLSSRHLVYVLGTTMEIRVIRPFIVSFIPGDQYGGSDCFYNHAEVSQTIILIILIGIAGLECWLPGTSTFIVRSLSIPGKGSNVFLMTKCTSQFRPWALWARYIFKLCGW